MKTLIPIALLVACVSAHAQEATPPETATPPAEPSPTPSPAPPKRALEGGPSNNLPKGSSLADVVRRSQADKPEARRSLGVITNDTLKGGPAGPGAKAGTLNVAPRTTAKAGSGLSSKVEPLPSVDLKDDKGRTEADWRNIIKKTQDRVDRSESEAKRLEDEVRKLENDFYAWSDGNYRDGVIKPTLDKAREDLKKARLTIDSARAAQSDLEEDARRSNTPPGWLRQK